MLKYNANNLIGDIKNFLQAGCIPYAAEPQYVRAVDKYLEKDKQTLETLFNQNGDRLVFVCFRDFVDKEKSSPAQNEIKDKELVAYVEKVFGTDARDYLRRMCLREEKDGVPVYPEKLKKFGCRNGNKGFCASKNQPYAAKIETFVFYGANSIKPDEEIRTFYHEVGHVVEAKLNCFYDANLRFIESVNEGKTRFVILNDTKNISSLCAKYQDCVDYNLYQRESFADTFASAVMLIKCHNEAERQEEKRAILNFAACAVENKFNGNVKSSSYNFWRMAKYLVKKMKFRDDAGKELFIDKQGQIDFLKVGRFCARVVKENCYSKSEYLTYLHYEDGKTASRMQSFRFLSERDEVAAFLNSSRREVSKNGQLYSLFYDIQKAGNKKQVLRLLKQERPMITEEMAEFRQVFAAYNPELPLSTKYYTQQRLGR